MAQTVTNRRAAGGRRRALIIAISSYRDQRLRNLRAPGKDANALSVVLRDPAIGFFDEVTTVTDRRSGPVSRALEKFCLSAKPDDTLLVHFSCHGIKDDGRLYFATYDTDLDLLESSAIASDFVNRQIARSRSQQKVLLLDCCYSGAFTPGLVARADPSVDIKTSFPAGKGVVVITASSSTEYSFEGEAIRGKARPSLFTSAVVEGLKSGEADRDRDGLISVNELFNYVADEVGRFTRDQNPQIWTYRLSGQIVIGNAPKRTPEAPTPTQLPNLGPSVNLSRWVQTDPTKEENYIAVVVMEAALAYQGKWVQLDEKDFFAKLKERATQTHGWRLKEGEQLPFTVPDLIATMTKDGVTSPDGGLFRARISAAKSPQAMVKALRQGLPLIAGFTVREGIFSESVSAAGQLPADWSKSQVLGWKVLGIFGYDAERGRWLLLTPWPSWGVGGFGWISLQELQDSYPNCWAVSVQPPATPQPVPQPAPSTAADAGSSAPASQR